MASAYADRLPRYKQLRQVGLSLNNQLVKSLTKEEMEGGAKKLGMWRRGTIVLDTEDQSSVLMDYCLHDVRTHGVNAIERFLATTPPPDGSDEMLLLQAKLASRYSIFLGEGRERGVGVQVRDLLRDESIFLTDVGWSTSFEVGLVAASRIFAPDGIDMTTGAGLPVGVPRPEKIAQLVASLKGLFPGVNLHNPTAQQSSDLATYLIRTSLALGAAERIAYVDAGSPSSGTQQSNRLTPVRPAGRNDPCPCGSGKKFKKCCGM